LINKDIIQAFSAVARDKNIDRTNLGTIIEDLFHAMIIKKFGEECTNFSVIANMDRGEIEIYQEMIIVENVLDPAEEITIKDAKLIEPKMEFEIGDPFVKVLAPEDFGRRAVNNAKQFLNQRIRDIEKQSIYDEYINRKDEIVMGYVHQIQKDNIFVNIDKTELRLPKSEQMINDKFRRGSSVRGVIKDIEWTTKGPEVIISRSDNQFLIRLFEMEVPEIEDGIIEIRSISRVAGDRSKVVVFSHDKRIDAVGACVGMRGSRIQSIVRECNGEKIDIINWSEQPAILISRAISPAKPVNLYIDENKPYAVAVFEDEELPIAIGRNGQNIKLASDVTGYVIDAVKKSEYESTVNVYLDELSGISATQLESLSDIGVHTSEDYFDLEKDELLALKGFGEKTIAKIEEIINNAIEEASAESTEDEETNENGETE
jgi:transcription termination/antitermination protein NusA